ncbi:MAG: CoA-transferase [Thermodesulfobacteriota bacterium]
MDSGSLRRTARMSEIEAAGLVRDGMTISLGSNYPLAITRQIIRRGVKNLTVMANGGGWDLDLMIAAGCVKKVVGYYFGGGIETIGLFFRRAAQEGEIEVFELDEGMLMAGLMAAAQMLPFLPWRGGVGTSFTDLNPELKLFQDPLRRETLLAVPALKPDIAFLRVSWADDYGQAQFLDSGFSDSAHYRAADKTIVQAERIVSNEEIRRNPSRTAIIGAAGVVHAPLGSHPFDCAGFYLADQTHLREYQAAARAWLEKDDRRPITEYLAKYVYEPETHLDYLNTMPAKQLFSLYA